jgi:hypothetical protein
MIEIGIGSPSRICAATGRAFEADDVICSYLVDEGGAYNRVDVLEKAAATFAVKGKTICRWKWTLKPRDNREKKEEKRATDETEAMFLAICGETDAGNDDPERITLKYLLALALQRKRILKPVAGKSGKYIHAGSGAIYEALPPQNLSAEILKKAAEKLRAAK